MNDELTNAVNETRSEWYARTKPEQDRSASMSVLGAGNMRQYIAVGKPEGQELAPLDEQFYKDFGSIQYPAMSDWVEKYSSTRFSQADAVRKLASIEGLFLAKGVRREVIDQAFGRTEASKKRMTDVDPSFIQYSADQWHIPYEQAEENFALARAMGITPSILFANKEFRDDVTKGMKLREGWFDGVKRSYNTEIANEEFFAWVYEMMQKNATLEEIEAAPQYAEWKKIIEENQEPLIKSGYVGRGLASMTSLLTQNALGVGYALDNYATTLGLPLLGASIVTPITALAGAGAAISGTVGYGMYDHTRMREAAGMYLEALQMKDANGEGLKPEQVKEAAEVVGIINGAIELLPLGVMASSVKKMFGKGIVQAVKNKGWGAFLKEAGITLGENILSEGTEEVLQKLVTDAAINSAMRDSKQPFELTPFTDSLMQGFDEAKEMSLGLVMQWAFGLPLAGVRTYAMRNVNENSVNQLGRAVRRVLALERQQEAGAIDPNAVIGRDVSHLPRLALNMLFEDEEGNPDMTRKQKLLDGLGLGEAFYDALQDDDEIAINKSTLDEMMKDVKPEVADAIRSNERQGAEGETVAEVAARERNVLLDGLEDPLNADSDLAAEAREVRDKYMNEAIATGRVSETEARFAADLLARFAMNMSERTGKPIAEIMQVQVRRAEEAARKAAEAQAADDALFQIFEYEEGDAAPDLTFTEKEINGKKMYGVAFEGQRPKDYKPSKVGKAYKLMELWPDGTLHPLFAGTKRSYAIGDWYWASGYSPDEPGGVKSMNLAPRYGWHMGIGLPATYHLMGIGSLADPQMGYYSKSGVGHPKGSKRVWVEVHFDASKDYTDVAEQNPSSEKDIRGLIPFGGYYMFQENNLSNWVISSGIKFDHILTDDERQKMLDDAGYNEELVWRSQVLKKAVKGALTTINKKLSGATALKDNETIESVTAEKTRLDNMMAENEARIKELGDAGAHKYQKLTPEGLARERERVRKEISENGTLYQSEAAQGEPMQTDQRYFAALRNGDMATAQRLLNERMASQGYSPESSYRMNHSAPNGSDGLSIRGTDLLNNDLVPDDYFTRPERYSTMGEKEKESHSAIMRALRSKDKTITMYRAVPANVQETKLRNGDWITPSRKYAEVEGALINGGYRIISEKVSLSDVWWNGDSINEFGYDDGKSYAYKDTANNRKSAEIETKDANGNTIPISQRFDETNASELYQSQQGTPMGSWQFDDASGQHLVTLFERGDASTLIHEAAHVMFETLKQIAEGEGANEWAHDMFATINEFVGYEEGQGEYTRAQLEKFADGFMQYLRTRSAPSSKLKGAFAWFRRTLANMVGAARLNKINLSPEIRELYDSLITMPDEFDQEAMRSTTVQDIFSDELAREKNGSNERNIERVGAALDRMPEDAVTRMRRDGRTIADASLDEWFAANGYGDVVWEAVPEGVVGEEGMTVEEAAAAYGYSDVQSFVSDMLAHRELTDEAANAIDDAILGEIDDDDVYVWTDEDYAEEEAYRASQEKQKDANLATDAEQEKIAASREDALSKANIVDAILNDETEATPLTLKNFIDYYGEKQGREIFNHLRRKLRDEYGIQKAARLINEKASEKADYAEAADLFIRSIVGDDASEIGTNHGDNFAYIVDVMNGEAVEESSLERSYRRGVREGKRQMAEAGASALSAEAKKYAKEQAKAEERRNYNRQLEKEAERIKAEYEAKLDREADKLAEERAGDMYDYAIRNSLRWEQRANELSRALAQKKADTDRINALNDKLAIKLEREVVRGLLKNEDLKSNIKDIRAERNEAQREARRGEKQAIKLEREVVSTMVKLEKLKERVKAEREKRKMKAFFTKALRDIKAALDDDNVLVSYKKRMLDLVNGIELRRISDTAIDRRTELESLISLGAKIDPELAEISGFKPMDMKRVNTISLSELTMDQISDLRDMLTDLRKEGKRALKEKQLAQKQKTEKDATMFRRVLGRLAGRPKVIMGNDDLKKGYTMRAAKERAIRIEQALAIAHEEEAMLEEVKRTGKPIPMERLDERYRKVAADAKRRIEEQNIFARIRRGVGVKFDYLADQILPAILDRHRLTDLLDGGNATFDGEYYNYFVRRANECRDNYNRALEERSGEKLEAYMQELGLTLDGMYNEVEIPNEDMSVYYAGKNPTRANVLGLYVLSKDPEALAAVLNGNLNGIPFAQRALNDCISVLSDEEKALGDYIYKQLNDEGRFNEANRVWEEVANKSMTKKDHYVSMFRLERGSYIAAVDEVALMNFIEAKGDPQKLVPGFTTERINMSDTHQTAVETDIFKIFTRHVQEEEHLIAYGEYLRDARDVLFWTDKDNRRSGLLRAIGELYGRDMVSALVHLYNDYATPTIFKAQAAMDGLLGRMTRFKVVHSLAWNIGVWLKNFASCGKWFVYANPVDVMASVWDCLSDHEAFEQRVYSLDPNLMNRRGNVVLDYMRQDFEARRSGTRAGRMWNRAMDAGIAMNSFLDRQVAAIMFDSIMRTEMRHGATAERAVQRAQEGVQRLMQPADQIELPDLWRRGGWYRVALLFTTEGAKTMNMLAYDLPRSLRHLNTMAGGFRLALGMAISSMILSMIEGSAPEEDEEDGEIAWGKWVAKSIANGTVGSFPVVGNEIMALLDSDERRPSGNSILGDPIFQAIRGAGKLIGVLNSEEEDTIGRNGMTETENGVWALMKSYALLRPFPYQAAKRLYQSLSAEDLKTFIMVNLGMRRGMEELIRQARENR